MSTPAWTFRRNFDRTGEYEIFDGEKPVAIVLNREDGVHDEEIARLIAAAPETATELARVKQQRDELLEALRAMVEVTPEPPESNCRCHLAAPCNDCVEYSALREAFAYARSAIAKVKGV